MLEDDLVQTGNVDDRNGREFSDDDGPEQESIRVNVSSPLRVRTRKSRLAAGVAEKRARRTFEVSASF